MPLNCAEYISKQFPLEPLVLKFFIFGTIGVLSWPRRRLQCTRKLQGTFLGWLLADLSALSKRTSCGDRGPGDTTETAGASAEERMPIFASARTQASSWRRFQLAVQPANILRLTTYKKNSVYCMIKVKIAIKAPGILATCSQSDMLASTQYNANSGNWI